MKDTNTQSIDIDLIRNDIYSKIPKGARLLFIGISGSTSYGLNTPKSDIDFKSVYIQSSDDILSNNYVGQVNIDKDHPSFEIRRFLELVSNGNPNAIELLFLNDEHIIFKDSIFETLIRNRDQFITKKCYGTFGGYAESQIKKATSTNKKYNWLEVDKTKKTIIDFARIVCKATGRSMKLTEWLTENEFKPEYVGLSKLEGHRDQYLLYVDHLKYVSDNVRFSEIIETRNYKGFGDGNEPLTSPIEQYMKDQWKGVIYWNREAYSTHCKNYKEYEQWKINSNKERVNTNLEHKQKFDSKNIMHLYRLVLVAENIVRHKTIKVDMTDHREELLNIKNGKLNLDEIIKISETKMANLKEEFEKSTLPEEVSKEYISQLELNMRNQMMIITRVLR